MLKNVGAVLLVLALAAVDAFSQNTFPLTGNVGIGTTNPNSLLTIGSSNPVTIDGSGNIVAGGLNQLSTTPAQLIMGNWQNSEPLRPALVFNSPSVWAGFGVTSVTGTHFRLGSLVSGFIWSTFGTEPLDLSVDGGISIGTANFPPLNGLLVSGNVGIGTTSPGSKLEVDGNLKLTSGSGASITFADGTVQSTAYTGVTCGGDYADSVDVSGEGKQYEPGDLLVLTSDGNGDVTKSATPYSTLVAGIYSTRPGTVGRRQTTYPKSATKEIPMAMVGIVPTKVSAENGPIQRGDLLVTAKLEGYAMKGTDRSRMLGAVVGKAMGSLDSGTGVIEVLVTLQ